MLLPPGRDTSPSQGYKYHGVEIDQSLTWRDHVDKIAKKASGGIGVLRCVRHLIPYHTLITMFKSIVLSYFDYCSIVWGSCGEGMRNRLQTLQNRAARVVTSSSYDRRSVEILDELGWDNLETRRTRQLTTLMYKLKNHIASDHLAQIFNSTNPMYSFNLRNIICLYQDCMLGLKKTASTIEGRSSGIVYELIKTVQPEISQFINNMPRLICNFSQNSFKKPISIKK